jgi:hypothetical protein
MCSLYWRTSVAQSGACVSPLLPEPARDGRKGSGMSSPLGALVFLIQNPWVQGGPLYVKVECRSLMLKLTGCVLPFSSRTLEPQEVHLMSQRSAEVYDVKAHWMRPALLIQNPWVSGGPLYATAVWRSTMLKITGCVLPTLLAEFWRGLGTDNKSRWKRILLYIFPANLSIVPFVFCCPASYVRTHLNCIK